MSFSSERMCFLRDSLAGHFQYMDLAHAPIEFRVVHEGLENCSSLIIDMATHMSFPVTAYSVLQNQERVPWENCVLYMSHEIAEAVPFLVGYAKNHQCLDRIHPYLTDLLNESAAVANVLTNYDLNPVTKQAKQHVSLLPKFLVKNKGNLCKAGEKLQSINIHIANLPTHSRPFSII